MAKTEVEGYENRYLKDFNHLKDKLMLLFTDNPNSKKFKFYGVSKDTISGLLVSLLKFAPFLFLFNFK